MGHYRLREFLESKAGKNYIFFFHFINGTSKESNTATSEISFCACLCLETSQTSLCFVLHSKKSSFKQDPQVWYTKILRILSFYSESRAFFKNPALHNPVCKIKAVIFHLLISGNSFPKHLFSPQSHTGLFSLCPCNLPSHHLFHLFALNTILLLLKWLSLLSVLSNSSFSSFLIALLYQVFIIGCTFCSSSWSLHISEWF